MVEQERLAAAKKYVSALFTDRCEIYCVQSEKRENRSTAKKFCCCQTDVPCRISFSYITRSYAKQNAEQVRQTVKLFLPPEIKVLPGARILVRRGEREYDCRGAGTPAVYPTHQMIKLERVGGWN